MTARPRRKSIWRHPCRYEGKRKVPCNDNTLNEQQIFELSVRRELVPDFVN